MCKIFARKPSILTPVSRAQRRAAAKSKPRKFRELVTLKEDEFLFQTAPTASESVQCSPHTTLPKSPFTVGGQSGGLVFTTPCSPSPPVHHCLPPWPGHSVCAAQGVLEQPPWYQTAPTKRSEIGLMPAKRKAPLSVKKGASAAARHDSKALSAAERGAQRATAAALEHEDVVDQARKRRRTRPKSPDAKAQSERRAKAAQRRVQRVTARATAAAVAIAKAAVDAPGSILATALPIDTDVDVEDDQVHRDTNASDSDCDGSDAEAEEPAIRAFQDERTRLLSPFGPGKLASA